MPDKDVLMKEYELALGQVSSNEHEVWQSTSIIIGANIAVFGFVASRLAANPYGPYRTSILELALPVIAGFLSVIILAVWKSYYLKRSEFRIGLRWHRIREIEEMFQLWAARDIFIVDEFAKGKEGQLGPDERERVKNLQSYSEKRPKYGGFYTLHFISCSLIVAWFTLILVMGISWLSWLYLLWQACGT